MLLKLSAPAGPARTEVLQLVSIFRARVLDVSDRSITVAVSGDPGKVMCIVLLKLPDKDTMCYVLYIGVEIYFN